MCLGYFVSIQFEGIIMVLLFIICIAPISVHQALRKPERRIGPSSEGLQLNIQQSEETEAGKE